MHEDEKFKRLRREIQEGIEQVRHSIQRAKWLLSQVGRENPKNTSARSPEEKRESKLA